MATLPPGGGPLDRPPGPSEGPTGPIPGAGPGPGGSPVGGPGGPGGPGAPGAPGGSPEDRAQGVRRAVTMMGAEIDRAITGVAQAINQSGTQDGLKEIAQARQLLEAGVAKFLATGGQAPSVSPTEAGAGFPGGGIVSGRP